MGRQKNDGRGRLGGRMKGTPNKETVPLKKHLRAHSAGYFTPDEKTGLSQYDMDVGELEPRDRIKAELDLLKFHTPMMQATAVDVGLAGTGGSFAQRLAQLDMEEKGKPA